MIREGPAAASLKFRDQKTPKRRRFACSGSNDGRIFFWLKEGRLDPDTVHFGFVAKSHAEVNVFFAAPIAAGGREKTAPAAQLQYHPDYYETWVLDPDGHDVEVVNKTGQID
jgi:hypothetical protein